MALNQTIKGGADEEATAYIYLYSNIGVDILAFLASLAEDGGRHRQIPSIKLRRWGSFCAGRGYKSARTLGTRSPALSVLFHLESDKPVL